MKKFLLTLLGISPENEALKITAAVLEQVIEKNKKI